jgi:antitoxin component of MazEF toxin-antitoxin module
MRKIVIARGKQPCLTLEDLLAQVTDDNLHAELDTGPPVGDEAW